MSPQVLIEESEAEVATAIDSGKTMPKYVNLVVGPFKIEVSRQKSRCNIDRNMELTWIKFNEKRCGGEADFCQINAKCWGSAT